MISLQTVKTVARFEMRTLLRGWFFRIFAGLTIIGLGIFNVAVFVDDSGAPWFYRAIPAAIPYANLIVLNLGQAIVAVFLASEFLKQDRKNDTIEVIYARSMTNAEYVLGKTLGILSVFFVLNIIVLLFGIGFSFLSSDSSKGFAEFLLYPLLISLPTLVYILGLAFLCMIVFKNQAITFILLLGYIAVSLFYLNEKVYHLFDFIAYQVPMMNSTIGGFGNFTEILIHRGIYLFLGIGLVFFTVYKIQRLPQSKKLRSLPIYLALIFLAAGTYLGKEFVSLKKSNINYKKALIERNNQYSDYPKVYIDDCQIELEHLGESISAFAKLDVTNKAETTIDTLIFSLNPELLISSLKIKGEEKEFIRDMHLIKIPYPKTLQQGQKERISFTYQGTINENTNYLDHDLEDYQDNFNVEIFRIRKRYSYVQEDFVCLTNEALWYPIAGVSYATNKPALFLPDFTNYTLKVKPFNNLVAVSQGQVEEADGYYIFKPEIALPKISLLIADYKEYKIRVDSIDYHLFMKDGNQYFEAEFVEIRDTLDYIVRELKNEFETYLGLDYPFKRFMLAEVPIQFSLDKHLWASSSDVVQPELTFFPEKAVVMEECDFRRRKKRFKEWSEDDNEEMSPLELEIRMFKRYVRGNFMASPKEWYNFNEIVDRNTFTMFPHYYTFVSQLRSENWPILNMALEAYLRERNVNTAKTWEWNWRGISQSERINLELKNAPMDELLVTGIEKAKHEWEQVKINEVILAKGDYLFSLFRSRYGEEEFNQMLGNLIANNRHKPFTFESLENEIIKSFGDTISKEVNHWYSGIEMPGYLVKDMETYKVIVDEYTKYQIKFKISNPEPVDGIVTVNIELTDQGTNNRDWDDLANVGFSRRVYIPAKSSKEVGYSFTVEPARMNIFTHISENLPNNLVYDFSDFDELRKTAVMDGDMECDYFDGLEDANSIIVDNEDEGFSLEQESNKSYLKSLVDESKKDKYEYTGLNTWRPPGEWDAILRSGFYGKYVRSARYTKSGAGERKAIWEPELKKEAFYDVYCHINKINISWGRQNRKMPNYHFAVHHNDGIEEVVMTDQELEDGWNYLGTFFISPETAKVVLNNESVGNIVYADAIKWVKNK